MLKKQGRPPAAARKPRLNDDIGEELRLRMYRMQVNIRQAEQLQDLGGSGGARVGEGTRPLGDRLRERG